MLIDYYKAIEDSSRKMLEAAKQEDWEQVVRYEGACAVLIEQLRARAASEALQPGQQLEKLKIMQRILKNDAMIRFLAGPWSDDAETMNFELLHGGTLCVEPSLTLH
jgi:flagellar protein FliT